MAPLQSLGSISSADPGALYSTYIRFEGGINIWEQTSVELAHRYVCLGETTFHRYSLLIDITMDAALTLTLHNALTAYLA